MKKITSGSGNSQTDLLRYREQLDYLDDFQCKLTFCP